MITLDDDDLGTLELRDEPFTVLSFQIGSPAVRANVRNRALANGTRDDTRFTGARAVTVALRLNEKSCDDVNMQDLFDRLMPYTNPARRFRMRWSLPGSGSEREMVVRGDTAPMLIAGPKHPTIALGFIAPEGEITTPVDTCLLINPAIDGELGRTYNLTFNRTYPASLAVGARVVTQIGNAAAHWVATIFGAVTNPYLTINGATINFNVAGGLNLLAGNNVQIDTRERTIYLNGDSAFSRYQFTNFAAWAWEDLLLQRGDNQVRFGGSVLGAGASVNLCWRPTWAG